MPRSGGRGAPPLRVYVAFATMFSDKVIFFEPFSDRVGSREHRMEKFIHRQNLEHYRKLLAQTNDEVKRETLLKLLAEEEAKDQLGQPRYSAE